VELGGEADVGVVEGDEEEGEALLDVDEEDAGLLVEFWGMVSGEGAGRQAGRQASYPRSRRSARSAVRGSCTSGRSSR
jgi:hypothetical protein